MTTLPSRMETPRSSAAARAVPLSIVSPQQYAQRRSCSMDLHLEPERQPAANSDWESGDLLIVSGSIR